MFLHFDVESFRFWVCFCLMKSHVNSGNILEFLICKCSRGIQELAVKCQRWNLKRSFYCFGDFPVGSRARLVIYLCLFLLTAKQSYHFRGSETLVFHCKMRKLSFTVCGAPQKYNRIHNDSTNSLPVSSGYILWPRCNFCLWKCQQNMKRGEDIFLSLPMCWFLSHQPAGMLKRVRLWASGTL